MELHPVKLDTTECQTPSAQRKGGDTVETLNIGDWGVSMGPDLSGTQT